MNALLDPGTVGGVRLVVHAEVSPRDPAHGQAFDAVVDVTNALQALDPDLTDVEITVVPGEDDPVVIDATSVPALADLDLGDPQVSVPVTLEVPGTSAKGQGESDAEYIARLRTYGEVAVSASVAALDGQAAPVAADTSRTLPVDVPILVVLDPPEATSVVGGGTAEVALTLANVGTATTGSTSVDGVLGGSVSGTASGLGAAVVPGMPTEVEVSYAVPSSHLDGADTSVVEIAWTDADDNPYGPLTVASDVWVTSGAPGAPTIALAWSGQTLFGLEPIEAAASDDVAVTAVDLLVDGSVVDTLTEAPYLFELDTTAYADGEHTLQARAHDGDDHAATSAPVVATIDNTLSSDLRVQADLVKGLLTVDEAAIEAVRAVVDPAALPERYESETAPLSTGTAALFAAVADWESLEPGTQEAVVDALLALDDDQSYMATPPAMLATIGDFADHCSSDTACAITTDHFRIYYAVAGTTNPPMVDAWELTEANVLQDDCGDCDGVPDWVDRLAYGLEQARSAYDDLGYEMPDGLTKVYVSHWIRDPSTWFPLEYTDRGMSLPWGIWIPYSAYQIENPIYIARHEFFHTMQIELLLPEGLDEGSQAMALFGTKLLDETADPTWLLEATAEWGAHQAEIRSGDDWEDTDAELAPQPGDPQRYAAFLSQMLKAPEQRLTHADGHSREYGAFVFAEFLEEWAAGPDTFRGDDPLTPVAGIIKDIWTRIGDGQYSLEALEAALEALGPGSSLANALPAYARANYVLGVDDVSGTYRDGHAESWQWWLSGPGSHAWTHGDGDPGLPNPDLIISLMPRPFRHAVEMEDVLGVWYQEPVSVQPGGSSYLEFKLPGRGGRYRFQFSAGPTPPVTATIMAFSSYPEPCVADTIIDLSASGPWVEVDLPDACTAATVILTHVDPAPGADVTILVGAESLGASDEFERDVAAGFGTADAGWEWQASRGGTAAGSVSGGAGHLPVGGINSNRVNLNASVTELLAVGHLDECSSSFDLVGVDAGATVYLTAGGLLLAPGAAGVALEGFPSL